MKIIVKIRILHTSLVSGVLIGGGGGGVVSGLGTARERERERESFHSEQQQLTQHKTVQLLQHFLVLTSQAVRKN